MTRTRLSAITAGVAGFTFTLGLNVAQADATLKEHLAVEGQGIMSFANMSGNSTTFVSGKRSRTDNDLQMESRLVRMFARGVGGTADIVRLDDDKVYELNTKKKTYTETTLSARRAQLQQAAEQAKQQQEKQPAPTGMDESQCEWSEPTVDVNKTGAKGTFAGYAADQVLVVAKQSCKDKKTGAVCDVALSLEEWVAPGFEGSDEVNKFRLAYAQQLGVLDGGRQVTERAEALFGRYKGAWMKVADKMKDIKGYPVKTSFAMGFGGAQCKNAQGQTASDTSGDPGATTPTSPGGLAGAVVGSVGSLFGRKKRSEEPQASGPSTSSSPSPLPPAMKEMIVPLRITSELLSFSKESLPGATFEPPADYKKVSE